MSALTDLLREMPYRHDGVLYEHALPVWLWLMHRTALSFRESVIFVRSVGVRLEGNFPIFNEAVREAGFKAKGAMSTRNPDSLLLVKPVDHGFGPCYESPLAFVPPQLFRKALVNYRQFLTNGQITSLPDVAFYVEHDWRICPNFVISDMANEWFEE